MIEILLSAVLLAPLPFVDDEEEIKPPDPAVVEATVDRLEAAYKGKDTDEILTALEAARAVLDRKVIKEVAKGLKHKESKVQEGSIEALRWMNHPEALVALHDGYKRNQPLMKDEVLAAALLKAVGQHADPSSLSILTDNPFGQTNPKAVQARIYGLGRIRTNDALASTIEMMNKAGVRNGGRRGNGNNRMLPDFRVTLTVLTGEDRGPDRDEWIKWWNDHKRTFEVSSELPELPKDVHRRWYSYWELEDPKAPGKKGRGGEDGKGGGAGEDGGEGAR